MNLLDQPLLPIGNHRTTGEQIGEAVFTIALGPLSIAGCADQDRAELGPAPIGQGAAPEWLEEEAPESDDEEGGMGAASAERTTNRYGIEGPEDNAAPQMAREEAREQSANAGAVGVLRGMTGAWNSPSGGAPAEAAPMAEPATEEPPPYDADMALGNDPTSALGALMGDQLDAQDGSEGDSFGFGGMGLRGTGRGGGGTGEGTIGLGNLGTIGHGGGDGTGSGYGRGAGGFRGRLAQVPRVRTGAAEVRGSLDSNVIRRVIRRHINEVRFCYEQQLNQQPGLAGRVTVSFVIGPTGTVQTASVAQTTLNNAIVEQCIAQAVRRWTFPAPQGGGIVAVNYPFDLSSSDDGSAPPAGVETTTTVVTTTRIVHTTDPAAHQRQACFRRGRTSRSRISSRSGRSASAPSRAWAAGSASTARRSATARRRPGATGARS
ncbi:MAG: AgmX/PglI C-terminal domain-containing protein [Sandaracinaceae bacterium]